MYVVILLCPWNSPGKNIFHSLLQKGEYIYVLCIYAIYNITYIHNIIYSVYIMYIDYTYICIYVLYISCIYTCILCVCIYVYKVYILM